MKRGVVLLALAVIVGIRALAQERAVTFEHFTLDDGLSNNVVTAISQDRFGFIWIGTEDGLNRFDGYEFTSYKHDPRDSSSIQSSFVTSLCRDSAGSLWIGTSAGLDRFEPGTGKFIHCDRPSDSAFVFRGPVRSLAVDREGYLWVGTPSSGLVRYDARTRRAESFRYNPADPEGIPGDSLTSLYPARDGRIWISGFDLPLVTFDPVRGEFTSYPVPSGGHGADRSVITSIMEDAHGNIWYTTFGDGVGRFNPDDGTFLSFRSTPGEPRGPSDNRASTLLEDAHGLIWIATFSNGIDCYDPAHNLFVHYPHDPTDPHSIGSPRVYALFRDRKESIWAGTWRGGVSVYHPWRRKFRQFRHVPGRLASLSCDTVTALYEDSKGRLWVGTEEGGLNRYETGRAGFVHYLHEATEPGSLSENSVSALMEDRLGRLWVATAEGGLNLFDEPYGRFIHYRHDPDNPHSLNSNRLMTMLLDRAGQFWIGTFEGVLNRFNPATGNVRRYAIRDSSEPTPQTHEIESIAEDSAGNLWIGTFGSGLYRFDKKRETFHSYMHRTGEHRSVPADGIFSLAFDERGDLWIGTFAKGLFRYIPARDSVVEYNELTGLPSNYVKGIVPDGRGNLWLSSIKGLARLTVATGTFRRYDAADGVQANEFRTGACFRGRSGSIYFGGVRGFNMFKPEEIRDNPDAPILLLTAFKVFDEPLRLGMPVEDAKEVELSHAQNYFSMEFVALDYTASRKNQYAYMLEGFDRDWITCGTRRFASYTHLDGGTYLFRVRGSNNDGVWNEAGVSLRIIVNPPVWETWWFRTLLALLIAAVPVLIYRARYRRSLAVERTRSHIARDLHDELSATLSGINFFTQAILRDSENAISQNSQRFLGLIHESAASLQESIGDIIWSVNPGQDHWDQIVAKFRRYASDLFDSKSIKYRFDFSATFPRKPVPMELKRNVWLIYKEIITNAAKHSRCSTVTIGLRFHSESEAELEVHDDGRGFDPEAVHGGNGLKNIRSRAESVGGRVNVVTGTGGGTRWNLRFPV